MSFFNVSGSLRLNFICNTEMIIPFASDWWWKDIYIKGVNNARCAPSLAAVMFSKLDSPLGDSADAFYGALCNKDRWPYCWKFGSQWIRGLLVTFQNKRVIVTFSNCQRCV